MNLYDIIDIDSIAYFLLRHPFGEEPKKFQRSSQDLFSASGGGFHRDRSTSRCRPLINSSGPCHSDPTPCRAFRPALAEGPGAKGSGNSGPPKRWILTTVFEECPKA